MNTLDAAAASDAVTIQMHDRVAMKSDLKKQGLVVAFRSERRVVVKWDQGDPSEQNTVMLKLLPKPKVATFCGYCLENFRLQPDKAKSMEDVLINSRNGQAFHLECARSIAITVALRERHLQQAPRVEAPPEDPTLGKSEEKVYSHSADDWKE